MSKKLYHLQPEHEAQFGDWAQNWIRNAMSTKPMDDVERAICVDAVNRLYASANLPLPKNIVFVPSPLVMRFAGGFAAAIWWLRNNPGKLIIDQATDQAIERATDQATDQAIEQATRQATDQATRQAIGQATDQATGQATRQATDQATDQATGQATRQATDQATDQATGQATRQATGQATGQEDLLWYSGFSTEAIAWVSNQFGLGKFGLMCAENAYSNMWQGGNQWSGWAAYLSFFRHVAKLDLDYTHWDAWETLALHSGPRIVHADFCMISDRPTILTVDDFDRPHADKGPFCRWRDGFELYMHHGTQVPKWIVTHPERITVAAIDKESNLEIKAAMVEKMGAEKYFQEAGGEIVDFDMIPIGGGQDGCIMRSLVRLKHGAMVMIAHDGGTDRVFTMNVDPDIKTCAAAHFSISGIPDRCIKVNA